MKNSEKRKEISEILAETYGTALTPARLTSLTDEIYNYAFTEGYDLADIIMTLNMAETEDERAMQVFHAVVDRMDDNALTAKKLYDCLLENFVDLDVLCKLLNKNAAWLSPEQKTKIKEAAECFDTETLQMCIWNWDDE